MAAGINTSLKSKAFQHLMENAHEGILCYHTNGKIVYVNQALIRVLGFTKSFLLEKNINTLFFEQDRELWKFTVAKLKPGKSIILSVKVKTKKGDAHWFEATITNKLSEKSVGAYVINFKDVHLSRESANREADSNKLLEVITQNVQDGIFVGMLGEKFVFANDAFLTISGYDSVEDLQKIQPRDLYVNDQKRLEILTMMAQGRVVKNMEVAFYKKDKTIVWTKLTIGFIKAPGRENQYIGTVQDITEKKKSEQLIRENQQLLSSISNNIQEGFYKSSPKHGLVYANASFARIFGYASVEEVLKAPAHNFYKNPEEREKLIKQETKDGIITNAEVQYRRKDGTIFIGSLYSTIFRQEDGEILMDGVIRDITQLKKREEEIIRLNQNLSAIMESTRESIYALDKNFCYMAFNKNHAEIMKLLYGAEIEIGGNFKNYIKHSVDEEWFPAEIQKALDGARIVKDYHVDYERYPERDIRITFNPIVNNNDQVYGAAMFVVDVTMQKKIRAQADKLLNNLSALIDSTRDSVFSVDRNLQYLIFNHEHKRQVKAATGLEIKEGDALQLAFPPEEYTFFYQQLNQALLSNQFTTEITFPKNIINEVSFNPVLNTDGETIGVAVFIRDVSIRKRNEQKIKLLNDELINQNWKLEAREEELKLALEELSERNFELDQFMYKTSHDLRSPLSSVLGLVNLAKADDDKNRLADYLLKIEGRIRKLDEFVKSMLNYARVSRSEVTNTHVYPEEIVNNCLRELEYLENFRQIQVKVNCPDKSSIHTDATMLRLILANIVSNAFKYYNPRVESYLNITITRNTHTVLFEFADNGIGIHKEYLDKIFDMFFRATEKSEGSGLGMYIVKQAVDKLKGKIELQSEYGKGTTITLEIPQLQNV